MKETSWVNLVLGFWLVLAPWVLHAPGNPVINNAVVGVIVIVIAAVSLAAPPSRHAPAWVNVAVGLWTLFSPWGLQFNDQHYLVANNAIVGALVIIFALVRTSAGRPVPEI